MDKNRNDNMFTTFLFFLDIIVDCSLKDTKRVMPAKKMKPRPKIRTFCGSMIPYPLNYAPEPLFRKHYVTVNEAQNKKVLSS